MMKVLLISAIVLVASVAVAQGNVFSQTKWDKTIDIVTSQNINTKITGDFLGAMPAHMYIYIYIYIY